jgi:hypothetical protein
MAEPSLTQSAVDTLNQLLQLDKDACAELLACRAKVNKDVAGHPHIRVQGDGDKSRLGILGILNGVLAGAGQDRVAMITDENSGCLGFIAQPKPVK